MDDLSVSAPIVIRVRGSQALRIQQSEDLLSTYRRHAERRSKDCRCDVYVVLDATSKVLVSVKYPKEEGK